VSPDYRFHERTREVVLAGELLDLRRQRRRPAGPGR
jgi:hypothetical protein